MACLQSYLTLIPLLSFIILSSKHFIYDRYIASTITCPLPPGPPGRLLIGNLGQVSLDHPEQDYIRWGKEYKSDVIHVNVLGQHMICLNSIQAATELLQVRGSKYCSRPRFTLFEIMGWGHTLTFLPSGTRFDRHRRLFHRSFALSSVHKFQEIQTQEAQRACLSLLASPEKWKDISLLYTTSIVFRIAYGQRITDESSPFCSLAEKANEATTNGGIAGSSIVDVFPLARYLPERLHWSKPLTHARKSEAVIREIHEKPWAMALAEIEAGHGEHSFMKTHLEQYRDDIEKGVDTKMTVADLKGATAAVFIAGGNSTWSTILSCILFLVKYPLHGKIIQQQIDTVTSARRLPNFNDRANLDYLDRFIKEVQRTLPANPLVIPHKSIENDVYKGMFIPKDSYIFANTKAMCSDPKVYKDPDLFDPDRYLRGEPFPQANFGFGLRKCPGNHLAMASVYIFLATLLATFDVNMVIGPDGKPLEPEASLTIGLGGHPTPFECDLTPRSREVEALLENVSL